MLVKNQPLRTLKAEKSSPFFTSHKCKLQRQQRRKADRHRLAYGSGLGQNCGNRRELCRQGQRSRDFRQAENKNLHHRRRKPTLCHGSRSR